MLPFLSPGLGRALWSFGLGFGATAAALGFMPFLLGGYREVAPVARYLPRGILSESFLNWLYLQCALSSKPCTRNRKALSTCTLIWEGFNPAHCSNGALNRKPPTASSLWQAGGYKRLRESGSPPTLKLLSCRRKWLALALSLPRSSEMRVAGVLGFRLQGFRFLQSTPKVDRLSGLFLHCTRQHQFSDFGCTVQFLGNGRVCHRTPCLSINQASFTNLNG